MTNAELVRTFRELDLCTKSFLTYKTMDTAGDWPQLAYPPLVECEPFHFNHLAQAQDMVIYALGNLYASLGGIDVALQWNGRE